LTGFFADNKVATMSNGIPIKGGWVNSHVVWNFFLILILYIRLLFNLNSIYLISTFN